MRKVIAYIDGFNLYYGIKEKYGFQYLWLDLPKLVKQFLLPDQQLITVKYFSAKITGNLEKAKRQSIFLDALSSNPQTEIHFGHYLNKKVKCHVCGAHFLMPEEKQTDVRIAISMLNDAVQNRFDTAFLVSGDSDLMPSIEVIKREYPNKRIVALFPPRRVSFQLKSFCHAYSVIGRARLKNCLFPAKITLPSGIVLTRPTKWN